MLKVHRNTNIFRLPISLPKANMFYHPYLEISLFICRARRTKLSQLTVIWTRDRDVRGMGLFSILRHQPLIIFFENSNREKKVLPL